jgi:hypothetical protein
MTIEKASAIRERPLLGGTCREKRIDVEKTLALGVTRLDFRI